MTHRENDHTSQIQAQAQIHIHTHTQLTGTSKCFIYGADVDTGLR